MRECLSTCALEGIRALPGAFFTIRDIAKRGCPWSCVIKGECAYVCVPVHVCVCLFIYMCGVVMEETV